MDSGHSNEARWPNNTLLTYTLPRTVKVRESVDVELKTIVRLQEIATSTATAITIHLADVYKCPATAKHEIMA